MKPHNLLRPLPADLAREVFETLVQRDGVTIERIVSRGHTSPEQGWYDQERHEWVLVLQGRGIVEFEEGARVTLGPGDSLEIPAHTRHRVAWTDPETETVWLAVHYRA